MSEKLKTNVKLGNGHLTFFPSIGLAIDDIRVGDNDEVSIEKVTIVPTLSSIFSDFKTVDIHVTNPVVKKSALEILSTFASDTTVESEPSPVNLRTIYID